MRIYPPLVLGLDQILVIERTLQKLSGRNLPIDYHVDNRTLFDEIAKNSLTSERGLNIDIVALREVNTTGERASFSWIPRNDNPANARTHPKRMTYHSVSNSELL